MADVKDIVYQGWLVKAPPDAKSALKVGSSLSSHSDNRLPPLPSLFSPLPLIPLLIPEMAKTMVSIVQSSKAAEVFYRT